MRKNLICRKKKALYSSRTKQNKKQAKYRIANLVELSEMRTRPHESLIPSCLHILSLKCLVLHPFLCTPTAWVQNFIYCFYLYHCKLRTVFATSSCTKFYKCFKSS